jgi:hypothetical protein
MIWLHISPDAGFLSPYQLFIWKWYQLWDWPTMDHKFIEIFKLIVIETAFSATCKQGNKNSDKTDQPEPDKWSGFIFHRMLAF